MAGSQDIFDAIVMADERWVASSGPHSALSGLPQWIRRRLWSRAAAGAWRPAGVRIGGASGGRGRWDKCFTGKGIGKAMKKAVVWVWWREGSMARCMEPKSGLRSAATRVLLLHGNVCCTAAPRRKTVLFITQRSARL
ncbi:protein LTO1 homolog isoform X2 [Callithrix jacchus]|uniref:protein LTO1 homolog isoform X3 n=1 Tax=Callithrix jacchus TaxID=9483 RepID=UPI00159DC132|nr:protein LTO1 homolog isoform X3 [Callithrix jacchus]